MYADDSTVCCLCTHEKVSPPFSPFVSGGCLFLHLQQCKCVASLIIFLFQVNLQARKLCARSACGRLLLRSLLSHLCFCWSDWSFACNAGMGTVYQFMDKYSQYILDVYSLFLILQTTPFTVSFTCWATLLEICVSNSSLRIDNLLPMSRDSSLERTRSASGTNTFSSIAASSFTSAISRSRVS